MHKLRTLHLFAGAGGGILADLLLGHQPVCAVEIDDYCQQVLSARQKDGILPWFPIFGDIKSFDGKPWRGLVDIVAGGFPCQDISDAGTRVGITGSRSGLWKEMLRVVREVQPHRVFVENAAALVNRGLGTILGDLAAVGYDARWGVFSAADAGAPHIRERIWILAHPMPAGKRRDARKGKTQKNAPNTSQVSGKSKSHTWKETKRLLNDRNYWRANPWDETTSRICRVDDGVANRVDRHECLGNGQVPAVAALAWSILK